MAHLSALPLQIVQCRLGDSVPMVIMHNLFKEFTKEVEAKLVSHILASVGEGNTGFKDRVRPTADMARTRLLQEEEELTIKRENLQQKAKRLQEGERKLKSFWSARHLDIN